MPITHSVQLAHSPPLLRVAFLLQPHFSLLAFTAAADALTTANLVTGRQQFQFHTVSLDQAMVISDLGIQIPCDHTVPVGGQASQNIAESLLSNTDMLLVCGGYRCSTEEDPRVTALLHSANRKHLALGGLWNGVFSLAHANLLCGYSCAVHSDNHSQAQQLFPALLVRQDTVVIDRDRLSAAGPNSAFDLMLSVVQRYDSASTVDQIRSILRADTSHDAAIDNALQRDKEHTFPQHLKDALTLMRTNLTEPVGKLDIARHINRSTRAMERLFQQHLNTSPSRYYLQLRLERAHEMLTQTDSSIAEIGHACGFVSIAHFSRAFNERYGQAPSKFRKSVHHMLDA